MKRRKYIYTKHNKYLQYQALNFNPNYDGYYAVEDFEVSCAMNDLQRFFNMYKDDYYA